MALAENLRGHFFAPIVLDGVVVQQNLSYGMV